jgi:four helix bundle protein
MLVAAAVYRETAGFPRAELFGLTGQMRRSAISIPSNLAEGCGRRKKSELSHFIGIAIGSVGELETQALLAQELGYGISPELISEIGILKARLLKFSSAVDRERPGEQAL